MMKIYGLIQFFAAFLAVIFFSITLEVNKKFIIYAGITGAIGWIIYYVLVYIGISVTIASLISAIIIAMVSYIFSKLFNVLTTLFLIPGILPIVPGIAMYRMVYYFFSNNMQEAKFYLFQAITIAGAIALGIFIVESITNIKLYKKEIIK